MKLFIFLVALILGGISYAWARTLNERKYIRVRVLLTELSIIIILWLIFYFIF